jgi:glycerophosphoryl diester phosphodiesterase
LTDDIIKFASAIKAYSLHVQHSSLDAEDVIKIHSHGIKVFAWTANEIDDINKMKEIGVDGIMSDFPDRIK